MLAIRCATARGWHDRGWTNAALRLPRSWGLASITCTHNHTFNGPFAPRDPSCWLRSTRGAITTAQATARRLWHAGTFESYYLPRELWGWGKEGDGANDLHFRGSSAASFVDERLAVDPGRASHGSVMRSTSLSSSKSIQLHAVARSEKPTTSQRVSRRRDGQIRHFEVYSAS